MNKRMGSWVLSALVVAGFTSATIPSPMPLRSRQVVYPFSVVLRYNVYTFNVSATSASAPQELTVRAFRGSLLLTRFQLVTDGIIVGADVADLDGNRFPELYVYTSSSGSGSFGKVYAWQFMAEQLGEIKLTNWPKTPVGYMGHDSLWVDRNVLCRRYPVYKPGDSNALPTGGSATVRYQLTPAGTGYKLVPEN